MNIVIGERCSGKTTRLIQKSAETGATIVTATILMADNIKTTAKKMGLDIPEPITATKLIQMNTNVRNNGVVNLRLLEDIRKRGILIDEAQIVLQNIFAGCRIDEFTMTYNDYDFEYLKELPRPRLWGQPVISKEQVAFVTTDGDEKEEDDISSGLGKCLGYSNVSCPKCLRMRLEYWSCGKHICEKCHWCIEDDAYCNEHRL